MAAPGHNGGAVGGVTAATMASPGGVKNNHRIIELNSIQRVDNKVNGSGTEAPKKGGTATMTPQKKRPTITRRLKDFSPAHSAKPSDTKAAGAGKRLGKSASIESKQPLTQEVDQWPPKRMLASFRKGPFSTDGKAPHSP